MHSNLLDNNMKYFLSILVSYIPLISFSQIKMNEFDSKEWKAPYTLDTPKGWGVEHFPIPIGFAPTIVYKGVEDIRFTPGWAKKERDEYWSYAFLWYLEGTPKFDSKILENNLIAYYTGLFNINTDKSKIDTTKLIQVTASIEERTAYKGDSKTFQGTVNMNDYMTKKPIAINLRIHVKYSEGQKNTFVFYEVSPMPYTNNVWTSLDQLWINLSKAQSGVLAKSYEGHKEAILGIAQSPDGKYLLSGSDDNLAFLWNNEGKIIDTIDVHIKSVNDVIFSPDSKRFITGGSEGDFVIWNIDGTKVATIIADKVYVKTIVYSSDGKFILSGGGDNTAKLWTPDGKLIRTYKGHNCTIYQASFSPDNNSIVLASCDNTASVWNIQGKRMLTLKKHISGVSAASFSPNGENILTASFDKTAVIWNLRGKPSIILKGHSGEINQAEFSSDGKYILTGSEDGTAKLWSSKGKLIKTFGEKYEKEYTAATFSRDGQFAIVSSK